MCRRSGYEYGHRFWIDDEIIPFYSSMVYIPRKKAASGEEIKCFLFEIRANFILKRGVDDDGEIMDSERHGATLWEGNDSSTLELLIEFRLKDYWMSGDEIQRLARDAVDFAKQMAAEPEFSSRSRHVIPVVVGLDVCTVKQEGELIGATIDRAIRAERLVPLSLWPVCPVPPNTKREDPFWKLDHFLWELPRIRVEDVDEGLDLMEVCQICLRNPTVGDQISSLPCHHAFHSRCIVLCLQNSNLCPVCGFQMNKWEH